MRTFVIGDVHGHADRLLSLLLKANIVVPAHATGYNERRAVIAQTREPVEVVQLGDLGHYGEGTQADDRRCWEIAESYGFRVLWGNHDMACWDEPRHGFRGFALPDVGTKLAMNRMLPHFAIARHGYLLTHAGLSAHWGADIKPGAEVWRLANEIDSAGEGNAGIIHAVGRERGGIHESGGVLWRDDREPLCLAVPQVYGHSRGDVRRQPTLRGPDSWCIDVAGKEEPGDLVGLWLPDLKVVAVGPNYEYYETPWRDEA